MKRRISLFFLTVSVALMMGHNLIPHCHNGHFAEEQDRSYNSQTEFCIGYGVLGTVFSAVAHNHSGMVFFEHLHGDVSLEKKNENKSIPTLYEQVLHLEILATLIKGWPLPPSGEYVFDPPNTRGLRAPPFFA